ncbi:MAG: hypothetical protein OER85_02845 [Gammaproteobacteria bacterium]|nr:hypothetical protein [Gammaproteobacteria bacterium]
MLLRQLFERDSYTYACRLAAEQTGEADAIGPMAEQLDLPNCRMVDFSMPGKWVCGLRND